MGKYFPLCVLQVLFLLLLEVFHSLRISKAPGEINACCSFKTFSPFILLYEIYSLNGNQCIIITEGVSGSWIKMV